jgi:hypothetical protein
VGSFDLSNSFVRALAPGGVLMSKSIGPTSKALSGAAPLGMTGTMANLSGSVVMGWLAVLGQWFARCRVCCAPMHCVSFRYLFAGERRLALLESSEGVLNVLERLKVRFVFAEFGHCWTAANNK